MNIPLLLAASDSPDLSLAAVFTGCLVLFFGVAVVMRLGSLVKESKKQTALLEEIARTARVDLVKAEKDRVWRKAQEESRKVE